MCQWGNRLDFDMPLDYSIKTILYLILVHDFKIWIFCEILFKVSFSAQFIIILALQGYKV